MDFIRDSFKLIWDLEKRSLMISSLKSTPKIGRSDDLKIIGKARMKIASRENVLDNFTPDIFVKASVLISLKGQLYDEDKFSVQFLNLKISQLMSHHIKKIKGKPESRNSHFKYGLHVFFYIPF